MNDAHTSQVEALRQQVARLEQAARERRQAEARSRLSEELTRRILEAVPAGILQVGPDGAILRANAEAVRQLGLTYAELTRLHVADFGAATVRDDGTPFPAEDYPVSRCLHTGLPQPSALIGLRRPDAQVAWVILTAMPLIDPQTGDPAGAVVTCLDFTSRKRLEEERAALLARAEAARQEAEEARRRVENVLESITDAFFTVDRQWRFTYVNSHAARLLRVPREELVGRNLWEQFPEAVGSRYYTEYRRAVEQNVTVHLEEYYSPLALWTEVHAYPTSDGLAVYFSDVTGRKRAEEALRLSEERHRLITDLTSDYVYTCEVREDGIIVLESATEGFERVTGYTLDEVLAREGWETFTHPEDARRNEPNMRRLLTGERTVAETRIITRSGEVRWVRYSSHPVWDEGRTRVVRFLGAVQDITERRRAEEQLQEYADRLQALSRRLIEVQEQERRFLARELHDEIGQDLTGLKLALETTERRCGQDMARALGEARRQLQDLAAKARDLSLRLRPTMLDDLGLVPALLWHFDRYQAQTGVRVCFDRDGVEGRLPAEVETAAYRIVQEALTNVARHAEAREVIVRVRLAGGHLCLQVEDGGKGFDPAAVHPGGSSGLSGMQERADLLGGRFMLESNPGAGTRLTAELPVHGTRRGECLCP
jgi:PAS domain S-box-containing protein